MAFKDLHKLKKVVVIEKEFINVPHLVVGKDIFALSIYNKLKDKYGTNQVRLLSEDPIVKSDLLPKGPNSIRGSNNHKIVKELYPKASTDQGIGPTKFYKEMDFKAFGGRSKPQSLKFNEIFFTEFFYPFQLEAVFPELLNLDEFLKVMNREAYQVKLKSIFRLLDGFKVECLNGTEFHCDKLYFGKSPYRYLEHYALKNELSDLFIEFCESTKAPLALFVKFVFEKPISEIEETLFIPLSYTHEWGHFMGEFNNLTSDTGELKQEIELMHFLDEDQASEDEISKVIRLLKKSMEKIFPKFKTTKHMAYIVLESEVGSLNINDGLYLKSVSLGKKESKNLFFLGINAPVFLGNDQNHAYPHLNTTVDMKARALLADFLLNHNI